MPTLRDDREPGGRCGLINSNREHHELEDAYRHIGRDNRLEQEGIGQGIRQDAIQAPQVHQRRVLSGDAGTRRLFSQPLLEQAPGLRQGGGRTGVHDVHAGPALQVHLGHHEQAHYVLSADDKRRRKVSADGR